MFWFGKAKERTAEFWRWLEARRPAIQAELEALGDGTNRIGLAVHELARRLHKVDPRLAHEIGMAEENVIELIVSANGDVDAFPAVTELVATAPRIEGVTVTAFRPRRPEPGLQIGERRIDGSLLRYYSRVDGDRLSLDLFLDCDLSEVERGTVAFLLLDQALGEYDVETGVGTIRIEGGAPPDAHPLSDLVREFDAFRALRAH